MRENRRRPLRWKLLPRGKIKRLLPWSFCEALFFCTLIAALIVVFVVLSNARDDAGSGLWAPGGKPRSRRVIVGSQYGLANRTDDHDSVSKSVLRQIKKKQRMKRIKEPVPPKGAKYSLAEVYREKFRAEHLRLLLPATEDLLNSTEVQRRAKLKRLCGEKSHPPPCVLVNSMNLRREAIKRKCSLNEAELSRAVDYRRFFIMRYRELLWCPVLKAASTNWMQNIPLLSNFAAADLQYIRRMLERQQPNDLARFVAPEMTETEYEALFRETRPVSFLISRHPFRRLISAYRDKIAVGNANPYFYHRFGRKIIGEWREKAAERFGVDEDSPPTFWEFVMAILSDDLRDDHWLPISQTCAPCSIDYDFIIRLENYAAEENFMINSMGLKYYLPEQRWLNKNENEENLVVPYLEQLNGTEIVSLTQYYLHDFELFGYDPSSYLSQSSVL